jgi:8-amino-7-oxononanoate synthase
MSTKSVKTVFSSEKTALKVCRVIAPNHNETALKVRKGVRQNHNETTLKVRKAIYSNHNESALKVHMGVHINHSQNALKVHKGGDPNHNETALETVSSHQRSEASLANALFAHTDISYSEPKPITAPTTAERKTIPPPTLWDVEGVKREGLYFWLKAILETRPNGRVVVDGYGEMLMLGGNSYLGLNEHPRINQASKDAIDRFGTGTHGSRLLAGTLSLHDELEQAIASFAGTEDSVIFSTGYLANKSSIASLLRKGDVILSDKMNHASIVDGCLSSQATLVRFKHNNLESLEQHLRACPADVRKLVIADAVFSMDGDILDLANISRLCRQYGAYLMVDEAHSVGVLGQTGRGIEEYFNLPQGTIDIKMGTISKAIPSTGGYIAGSYELCTFLRHEARGFIYSGSPTPASMAAALESLKIIQEQPQIIAQLHEKATYFKQLLQNMGFDLGRTQTPIVPIIIGDSKSSALLAKYCQEDGLFIHAIYPPVVPEGSARLRASIMASHTYEALHWAADVLKNNARKLGILS